MSIFGNGFIAQNLKKMSDDFSHTVYDTKAPPVSSLAVKFYFYTL